MDAGLSACLNGGLPRPASERYVVHRIRSIAAFSGFPSPSLQIGQAGKAGASDVRVCTTLEPPAGRLSTPSWCGQQSCAHGELALSPDIGIFPKCYAFSATALSRSKLLLKFSDELANERLSGLKASCDLFLSKARLFSGCSQQLSEQSVSARVDRFFHWRLDAKSRKVASDSGIVQNRLFVKRTSPCHRADSRRRATVEGQNRPTHAPVANFTFTVAPREGLTRPAAGR
jgi:hypothetical protein